MISLGGGSNRGEEEWKRDADWSPPPLARLCRRPGRSPLFPFFPRRPAKPLQLQLEGPQISLGSSPSSLLYFESLYFPFFGSWIGVPLIGIALSAGRMDGRF